MPFETPSQGLPAVLPQAGTLFLSVPHLQTKSELARLLVTSGGDCHEPYPGVLAVRLWAGSLERLAGLLDRSTAGEVLSIKCRIVPEGHKPTLAELMQSQPLCELLDRVQCQWLVDLLDRQDLVTHFQPIVSSLSPDTVFAYECLVRGKQHGDTLIYPDRLFKAARQIGVLSHLDRLACLTAIQAATTNHVSTNIFINFNPSSIYDPLDCLRNSICSLDGGPGIEPERFVFEVVESEEIREVDLLLDILDNYRQLGFRIALDDLGAGYSSLNLLTRLKPDFIKLDMGLIRNVDRDRYKGQVASKLLELARELGVRTVVEGVETVGEWQWAREHGADFAQGYLFARPSAAPPKPSPQLPILAQADGGLTASLPLTSC